VSDDRIVRVSGHEQHPHPGHDDREGVNFLQKPFSPISLAVKVREVLDAPVANGRV
jgi:hypothetical protein